MSTSVMMHDDDDDASRDDSPTPTKVLVLAGPTAAGKSSLAIALARALNGEIVSCDSVQVYRALDVGSGKVTRRERVEARHHMLDIAATPNARDGTLREYAAGEYYDDAMACLDDIRARGKVPIVVGGSGMYLRFLTNGKPSAPASTVEGKRAAMEAIEAARERGGWSAACDALRDAGDAVTPERLSENDWYRLTRAYEIVVASGGRDVNTFASAHASEGNASSYDFRCFFMCVPRVELYRRIDARVEDMVCDGMLDEAAMLLDNGVEVDSCTAARAIGYRQSMEYLSRARRGDIDVDVESLLAFVDETQQVTRAYAKRQYTWFRGEPEGRYLWIDASKDREELSRVVMDAFASDVHQGGGEDMSVLSKEALNEIKRYKARLVRLQSASEQNKLLDRIRNKML